MRNTTLSTQAREYKIQSASVGHTNDRSIARPTRRRRVVVRRPRRGLIHLRHGRNDGAYRNGSGGEHTGPRLENKSGSRRVWRHALRCHITFQCCNYPGRRLLQRCGSRKRVTGTMTPLSLRSRLPRNNTCTIKELMCKATTDVKACVEKPHSYPRRIKPRMNLLGISAIRELPVHVSVCHVVTAAVRRCCSCHPCSPLTKIVSLIILVQRSID